MAVTPAIRIQSHQQWRKLPLAVSQAVYRSSLWRNRTPQDLNIYRLVPNHKDMFSILINRRLNHSFTTTLGSPDQQVWEEICRPMKGSCECLQYVLNWRENLVGSGAGINSWVNWGFGVGSSSFGEGSSFWTLLNFCSGRVLAFSVGLFTTPFTSPLLGLM